MEVCCVPYLFATDARLNFIWANVRYSLECIEKSPVLDQVNSDPSDVNFLISHLSELPDTAQKYLIWATLFGST